MDKHGYILQKLHATTRVLNHGLSRVLKITLLAVGDRMPAWIDQGFVEYQKRIGRPFRLGLVQIPALRRPRGADMARIQQQEESRILASVPNSACLIALDKRGLHRTTEQVAENMKNWLGQREPVALAIGGPEGFSEEFIGKCNEVWSLSDLTFPHGLARVIVAEQLYRGYSILQGLPYHR